MGPRICSVGHQTVRERRESDGAELDGTEEYMAAVTLVGQLRARKTETEIDRERYRGAQRERCPERERGTQRERNLHAKHSTERTRTRDKIRQPKVSVSMQRVTGGGQQPPRNWKYLAVARLFYTLRSGTRGGVVILHARTYA